MTIKFPYREQWLNEARVALTSKFFCDNGYDGMPEQIACSCGFPKGSAKAIGQCWSPEVTADGTTHIFICPTQAEPVSVLATMLHELIHAYVGVKEGHKGPFRKMAKEFGLAGKMTATFAEEGGELWQQLAAIGERLGVYPNSPMVNKPKSKRGSMGGWVRLESTSIEGYKVLISPKKLEEFGYPLDPTGEPMVEAE